MKATAGRVNAASIRYSRSWKLTWRAAGVGSSDAKILRGVGVENPGFRNPGFSISLFVGAIRRVRPLPDRGAGRLPRPPRPPIMLRIGRAGLPGAPDMVGWVDDGGLPD